MRAAVLVVVLFVICQVSFDLFRVHGLERHLGVAIAEAASPPDTPEDVEALESGATVIDTPRPLDAARARVTVRVYSATNLDEKAQHAALDVASGALQAASVQIVWKICAQGGCDRALTAVDLAVRMVLSGDPRPGAHPLGHALIDRETRTGVLATAYVDRTLRLARALSIDHARLLGRTVAHEIAHLLLGSTTHGSGLMREYWSHLDLLRAREDDWVLNPADADAIRKRTVALRRDHSRSAS